MAGFGAASIFLKIGIIISILGFLFHVIGLATPYWTSKETNQYGTKRTQNRGLWKSCEMVEIGKSEGKKCNPRDPSPESLAACAADAASKKKLLQENKKSTDEQTCTPIMNNTDWFEACQTFAVLGCLAGLFGLIALMFSFIADKPHIHTTALVASFVSAGCILLCVIIYGAKSPVDLSWSFALSIVGMFLEGVTATLLFINKRRGVQAN